MHHTCQQLSLNIYKYKLGETELIQQLNLSTFSNFSSERTTFGEKHEDLSPFLQTTDSRHSIGNSWFEQIDPKGFVNSDANTSQPSFGERGYTLPEAAS